MAIKLGTEKRDRIWYGPIDTVTRPRDTQYTNISDRECYKRSP